MRAGTRFERMLRAGHFTVTAELSPPDGAHPELVNGRVKDIGPYADAINVVDASGANVHMSSVAVCALLVQTGYEPVLQVACRDKNRIAIQGDLLGAHALGMRNVLCLTGDGVQAGDHPEALPVFDFDSMMLLRTARILRDQGHFLSGRKLETSPQFFLGGAENPFVPPYDFRPHRLAKKVEAGADFIQTQYCYDVPRLVTFMQKVRDLGLHEKVFILIGVGPLRSAKVSEWMRSNVPGVVIPGEVIKRLEGAPKGKQKEEGMRVCVEIIQQIREIPGIHGIHIMAYKLEELIGPMLEACGLLPRPWQQPAWTESLSPAQVVSA
jgi:methylenetetrahydrofolate reductase (NADPH)